MLKNVIITVFKIIAIFLLGMIGISLAVTTFMFFSTYNKLDAVGQLMQSELSRNNCLLRESMGVTSKGDILPDGYIAQILDICKVSNMWKSSDDTSTPLYTLKSITVENVDGSTGTYYYYNADGSPTTAFIEPVGEYGKMKKITITYDTNFSAVMHEGSGANLVVKSSESELKQVYIAPCLRYIK